MFKIFFKHCMYATVFIAALCGIAMAGYEIGYWIAERYPEHPWAWLVVPAVCAIVAVMVYSYEATKTELAFRQ